MHNAMFISWGMPVRGREIQATKVFGEWIELLGTWQSKGTIKSFTPCFLAPLGRELGGFFLVTGEPAKLDQLHSSDEIRRAMTRAQLIVDNFCVTRAMTGDEIAKQMQLFTQSSTELAK